MCLGKIDNCFMSLQDIYYLLSIVTLLLWIAFLGFATFILYFIYKTVKSLPEEMKTAMNGFVNSNKGQLLSIAATTILPFALGRFKSWFSRG